MALFSAPDAWSQELDYGKYESLFGEPVTISATGKPERLSDSPILMDLITADDIKRSGARDIPTLVRRLAGVDLTHTSTASPQIGLGAYPQTIGSQVMVLVNGRQIYFDGFGDLFWSAIPVELPEIRQIEVIRGPESALYGFNAVDGVINIVTFDPVDDAVNSATARVGNHRRRDLSTTTTFPIGSGAGVRLTAAYDHAHDYGMTNGIAGRQPVSRNPDRRMASLNGGLTLDDGARVSLEASHVDISEREAAYAMSYDVRVVTDSVKLGYTNDSPIGRLTGSASYSQMNAPWLRTQFFGPSGLSDRSTVLQLSDLLKVDADDSLRFGIEGRHDTFSAGAMIPGTTSNTLGSGSMMWEHTFSPGFSLVNAARYDYSRLGHSGTMVTTGVSAIPDFDRSIEGFSTNSALLRRITDDDTLRLSFARGLQLPSIANYSPTGTVLRRGQNGYEGDNDGPATFFPQPAVIYDYQAGWDHQIRDWDAMGRVTYFHQMTMRHLGSPFAILNGAIVDRRRSPAGIVANGVTLSLRRQSVSGWTWGANYTYTDSNSHDHSSRTEQSPAHKVNASVGYGWDRWDADLFLQYASHARDTVIVIPRRRLRMVTATVGDTLTLSPRVGWHANDWLTIEASADNLWPYRDTLTQRQEATYLLSVKITY